MTYTTHGATPGAVTPNKESAGSLDTTTADSKFATESIALKSKFAMRGHLVRDGDNDDYIVVKSDWCMSKHCRDHAALVAFGRVLGVL